MTLSIRPTDAGSATLRNLRSLTQRDAAAIRAAIGVAGGGWVLEEHDDYDGFLSFMIAPEAGGPVSFMVSGRSDAVELAQLHDDSLIPAGRFASVGAAVPVLRDLLAATSWVLASALPDETRPAELRELVGRLLGRHGEAGSAEADAARADSAWASVLRVLDELRTPERAKPA